MKFCPKCASTKALSDFGKNCTKKDGLNTWCSPCCQKKDNAPHLAEARRRYEHTAGGRARRENHPEKEAAGRLVRNAVKSGHMVRPGACEKCGCAPRNRVGRVMIEAHHPDYSKPYEVMWLCKPCHAAEHTAIRDRLAAGGK